MTSNPTLLGRTPVASGAWRLLTASLALASAALLSACGGGGTAGVGTGGTGAFGVGTVTSFGSVYVNGIKYENDTATVFDDGDSVSSSSLKLGMVVEVSGSVDDSGTVRTANQIAYGAEIKGPVFAVGAGADAGTFTVFNNTIKVRTTATTVYANFDGTLSAGNVVEVHGYSDTNGDIVATYVERKGLPYTGEYRLRGAVAGLSGTSPTYTFTVRGVPISTNSGTDLRDTPVETALVNVRMNPTLVNGSYLATRLKARSEASYGNAEAENEAEVEGYVTELTLSPGFRTFKVAGYPVQLPDSGVTYRPEEAVPPYTAANLADGIRVEVKGSIRNGVLVVTRLKFESSGDDDGVDDNLSNEFESTGIAVCSNCAVTTGTFTINGVTVTYDTSIIDRTVFEHGLISSTFAGPRVEVKYRAVSGSTGTTYFATRIKLDSND